MAMSAILVDGVSKNATQAGALLNDGAWHHLQFDLDSVAASDLRIGTDNSVFGNIVVDQLELNAGVLGEWKFDDGGQGNPLTGDPIIGHRSIVGDWYFLQDSVAKRPLYDSAGMNSRPTIEFNGLSKLLYSTQVTKATQQGCVSLAIRPAAVDAAMAFFALTDITGDVDYCYLGLTAAGKLIIKSIIGVNTTSVTGGTTLVAGERVVVQFWSDGTTRGIALNGVAETLTASGTDTGEWFGDVVSPDYWSLGALKAATEALYFNGEISHYLGYDDETSTFKRGRMYLYLKKLYGIGA